ncbi:MAG: HicA protein [Desulfobulbaceae bacterium]|nr:HicA protein [Desulfobulbaceae bacterium]
MKLAKIEPLLMALGGWVIKGMGSNVTFERDGILADFHRPHQAKAALRYRIKNTCKLLKKLGEII